MIELTTAVAVIIGISEIIKEAKLVNAKYIPILNLAIGIIICLFLSSDTIEMSVFEGLIAGLTASGLFSGTKNIVQKIGGK